MYKLLDLGIKNTICEAREINGNIVSYRIAPIDGYKLHEITLDENIIDENGNEIGKIKKGYTTSYVTAGVEYNFEKNDREIYAVEK